MCLSVSRILGAGAVLKLGSGRGCRRCVVVVVGVGGGVGGGVGCGVVAQLRRPRVVAAQAWTF